MHPLLVGVVAFIGVSSMLGGVILLFQGKQSSHVEDRLQVLTSASAAAGRSDGRLKEGSLLTRPLSDGPGMIATLFERFGDVDLLFEQADTSLTVSKFAIISIAMAVAGSAVMAACRIHAALVPVAGVLLGALPMFWLLWRRGRRLKAFGVQLPEALEMVARVLRAGQSLAFGFSVVSSEMPNPICREFGRVFEEQNLGIPVDDSLNSLCARVPNLDLRFFATAIILQRQTGGDLAEILDKIGSLIRERFQIWGQVQALTGEGRLSGVVLLALPLLLFGAVYRFNPTYVSTLFTDPMGQEMLAVAVVMQVLGALVIRKIVNIKV